MPTPEEIYATALADKKEAVKAYINDANPTRALAAIQLLLSATIQNAGSLENLTAIQAALQAKLG